MDAALGRLRLAREVRNLTLGDVSRVTGYAVSTLSNAECGRDRLSAEAVDRIAHLLEVSTEWLNTGKGPMFRKGSAAAKIYLEAWLPGARQRLAGLRSQRDALHSEADKLDAKVQAVETALKQIESGKATLNLRLTDVLPEYKYREMKARLPELIELLRRLTRERGRKSELAAFLGVPLSHVSEWLRPKGKKKPGGEKVLQLLQWAEQQEAQQNGPAGVSTPTEPKAQSERKSDEEKPIKPGPA